MKLICSAIAGVMLLTSHGSSATNATTACEAPVLALTYNIRLDTPSDGANAWPQRKDFLTTQLSILRPDILGMQEVLPNQRSDIELAMPDYLFVGGGRDDGKYLGEASPLAINRRTFSIGANGVFWLSPTPDRPSTGWDARFKRVATWARLKRRSDGARLLVVNTHWDHEGVLARKEGGKLIKGWLAKNRRKYEQVVLMGDFNAEVPEESIGQLLQGNDHLVDTRHSSAQPYSGTSISFNGFEAFPRNGSLIDHIFVSPDIRSAHHMVMAQHENGRVASDHFPVAALLDIPSPHKLGRNCGI